MRSVLRIAYCVSALMLAGCAGTVTPRVVQSSQASWDGGEQTSGILEVWDVPGGGKLFHVTAHFVERYNALIEVYGNRFKPALNKNAGVGGRPSVTDAVQSYTIDAEHLADFLKMNRWRKQEGPTK